VNAMGHLLTENGSFNLGEIEFLVNS
jgi:hypothetical protein